MKFRLHTYIFYPFIFFDTLNAAYHFIGNFKIICCMLHRKCYFKFCYFRLLCQLLLSQIQLYYWMKNLPMEIKNLQLKMKNVGTKLIRFPWLVCIILSQLRILITIWLFKVLCQFYSGYIVLMDVSYCFNMILFDARIITQLHLNINEFLWGRTKLLRKDGRAINWLLKSPYLTKRCFEGFPFLIISISDILNNLQP